MKRLLLALIFGAVASLAQAGGHASIMDPVPGHDGVSYFELLRQVIPDLAATADVASGHLPEGIGHLEGDEAVGEMPEIATISAVEAVSVRADGQPMLWVLADLGAGGNVGNYTLLAVFDEQARLLDAVEVDTDRLTGLVGTPFAISPGDEAMQVGSEHHNSSQSYQSRMLAFLDAGKLKRIDTVFAFGTRGCDLWQTEELAVHATESDAAYWTITATVTRNQAPAGPDCTDPADAAWQQRDFTAIYAWDAAAQHFVAGRRELDDLAELDEALF
ncbi:MAG: hypothetical protein EOP22_13620 [Hyphomicrobiales bacterium]|nr:MAG: hypothetical protein EOP22_13620 [Hyphomicrobiales bacterium]